MFKIGILERGLIQPGSTAVSTINEIIECAKIAERLGFSRFWLTEHQGSIFAWQTPEIIVSLIASSTSTIRVGVAGVLFPLHNVLNIAQQYLLLNNIYNNRIDLGITKGSGDEIIEKHLLTGTTCKEMMDKHYDRFETLIKYLYPASDEDKVFASQYLSPKNGGSPKIWVLGSSNRSMPFAIKHKLPFSYSIFHPESHPGIIGYLENFINEYRNINSHRPLTNVALSVILGKTQEDALHDEKSFKPTYGETNLVGTVDNLIETFYDLHEKTGVTEFILIFNNQNRKAVIDILHIISKTFKLQG